LSFLDIQRCTGKCEFYFLDDTCTVLHRLDGPARIFKGTCILYELPQLEWYVNGLQIHCKTQEEFEQYMRLKAFL